jgi:hypothetical protein
MNRFLIKQAIYLPLGMMLAFIVWAMFVPDYSSVVQHMSELQLLQHPIAFVTRIIPVIVGLSVMAFGVGVLLQSRGNMMFTAATALVFGAANTSNGIYISGNPLHGLYGLAMFYVLVPACFAAELPRATNVQRVVTVSLAIAFVSLTYFWLQFSQLDPHGFRGLTQRAAVLMLTGWYTYAANFLLTNMSSWPPAQSSANNSFQPTQKTRS